MMIKCYYVIWECFNNICKLFKIEPIEFKGQIFIDLNGKRIMVSEEHQYDSGVFKIYNNDQYPFYIQILTKEERIIKEIIE